MEPVRYIDRTTADYLRQGYDTPYKWAHHTTAPFTPLKKPLSECKVGLIGTSEVAVRFDPDTEENPIVEEEFQAARALSRSFSSRPKYTTNWKPSPTKS